jgi:D-xylonolactonase
MSADGPNSRTLSGPECLVDYGCETGENPLWHPLGKRLYWCDIPKGRVFRFDPATGTHEQCYEGRTVGGFTIRGDGSLLLFMDRGTITISNWRGGELTTVLERSRKSGLERIPVLEQLVHALGISSGVVMSQAGPE